MRNIVIMPFGRSSRRSEWIFNSYDRPFDVLLLTYHPPAEIKDLNLDSTHYRVLNLQDFKWVMIHKLLVQNQDILNRYDYFFFVDDDIEISLANVENLFLLTNKYNLVMSQPVLSRDSYKSWRVLRKKFVSGIRYLSTVELMCPVMSRVAVEELLPTFNLNKSGWGIDILWGDLIRRKFGEKSIAVFDLIVARHAKPVGQGELYEKLGKSAFDERDEIFQKYQLKDTTIFELPLSENTLVNKVRSYFKLRNQLTGTQRSK